MRRSALVLLVAFSAMIAVGCAYTDYTGYPGHKTTSEAKFWGTEISFSGFSPNLDGTYSYTGKYNNIPGIGSDKVTIYSYHNPVVSSFSRDGQIDRDGDDVQGGSGTLGGKFNNGFVSVDNDPATCGFFDNITQNKLGEEPGIALCGTVEEEIDADFELGAAFASLDDLLGQIWSGALRGDFTLELTSIRLNGVRHDLIEGVSIGARAGTNRPVAYTITNGPGVQELVGVILNNTQSGEPVAIGFGFDGGLSVDLPASLKVAFNHDVLLGL